MDILLFFILAIISYFLGFPSAHIVGKINGIDITKRGSGNPGATNIGRILGKKASIAVFLIDAGKAYFTLFVIVGFIDNEIINNEVIKIFLGVFLLLGNFFPLMFNFKGGKGVSTLFGVTLSLNLLAIIGIISFLIGIKISKNVAISSLISIFISAVFFWVFNSNLLTQIFLTIFFLIIIYRHKENLKKIFNKKPVT